MKAKRRVGRPTTAAKEGEKAALGIRATAALKRRLQEASVISGRSLSAEAEFRLERSFSSVEEALDAPALGPVLFKLLAAFTSAGLGYGGKPGAWLTDPHIYCNAMVQVALALGDSFPGGFTLADWQEVTEQVKTKLAEREIRERAAS